MDTPKTTAPSTQITDTCFSCMGSGWVTIGHIAFDADTGEEVEEFALYLCRRCAER